MEAVKQGSATVGLKSKTHAVLVALKVMLKLCPANTVSGKVLVWQISLAQCELLPVYEINAVSLSFSISVSKEL